MASELPPDEGELAHGLLLDTEQFVVGESSLSAWRSGLDLNPKSCFRFSSDTL
jgi:hypothetical protein